MLKDGSGHPMQSQDSLNVSAVLSLPSDVCSPCSRRCPTPSPPQVMSMDGSVDDVRGFPRSNSAPPNALRAEALTPTHDLHARHRRLDQLRYDSTFVVLPVALLLLFPTHTYPPQPPTPNPLSLPLFSLTVESFQRRKRAPQRGWVAMRMGTLSSAASRTACGARGRPSRPARARTTLRAPAASMPCRLSRASCAWTRCRRSSRAWPFCRCRKTRRRICRRRIAGPHLLSQPPLPPRPRSWPATRSAARKRPRLHRSTPARPALCLPHPAAPPSRSVRPEAALKRKSRAQTNLPLSPHPHPHPHPHLPVGKGRCGTCAFAEKVISGFARWRLAERQRCSERRRAPRSAFWIAAVLSLLFPPPRLPVARCAYFAER